MTQHLEPTMAVPELNNKNKAFERLHPKVQRWIYRQGWAQLHAIQAQTIHAIFDRQNDLIVTAPTAGGKTEAAFLPICSQLIENAEGSVRVLCLSPLKALINDQIRRLEFMTEDLGIPVQAWHGDISQSHKTKLRKKPRGILLITPESVEALLARQGRQIGQMFALLDYIIIDELHAFIGSERGKQLQSQMYRLEVITGRKPRRIGLSATLGDMSLAAAYLNPHIEEPAQIIRAEDQATEILLAVKGYEGSYGPRAQLGRHQKQNEPDQSEQLEQNQQPRADYDIGGHLFQTLRQTNNLVFTNNRAHVEIYSDYLRRQCAMHKVPSVFWPHHGSLAKDPRETAEARLKDPHLPATVICTTTLEMGLDVGDVDATAQIGAPPSVASLRQRLGRSGRRQNDKATMRIYICEPVLEERTPTADAIRPELFQTVAMINLLLRQWYEPPRTELLHLSTLVQQLLSSLAQYGGLTASNAWRLFCQSGPFTQVDQQIFAQLLRALAQKKLIIQMNDGLLILGEQGERLVNHYNFYAAFNTPEEYRIVTSKRTLGRLDNKLAIYEGLFIIFAGERWVVNFVDHKSKTVEVSPSAGGWDYSFSGGGWDIHHRVRREMFQTYLASDVPSYLDAAAKVLLQEGRNEFKIRSLYKTGLLQEGNHVLMFPWCGSCIQTTLLYILKLQGFKVAQGRIAIEIQDTDLETVRQSLQSVLDAPSISELQLAVLVENKASEKFDEYLSEGLLNFDISKKLFNVKGAEEAIRTLFELECAP